jgi:phosphate transport system substrate-binding protein
MSSSLRMRQHAATLGVAIAMFAATVGHARDRILVVGSTTVLPFSTTVAYHFAKSGSFATPEIRATNTGDGLRQFCESAGADSPDVANASRTITPAERSRCAANGVGAITEVRIGYDSLVLVGNGGMDAFNLTREQFWRAIAKFVDVGGRLVPNPYQNWRDIGGSLPDRPIEVFGPSPGHGTRDALATLVMEPSCLATPAGTRLAPDQREGFCQVVREDGRWIDSGNIELILGKLATRPRALGVLTYSYLEQFPNRLSAARIDGIQPNRTTISSGAYPISRPLFLYVKDAHVGSVAGLADFTAEFLSLCAAGTNGYLLDEGLVPLPTAELQHQRAVVARLQR